jgi:drug/metabolite transporter (DMT)-like permease
MPPPQADVTRGILLMLGTIVVFPVMNAMAKTLGQGYSPLQVVHARASVHVLAVALFFGWQMGFRRLYRSRRPKLQLARSSLQLVSNSCFFFAIPLIPLAEAQTISFVTPFIICGLAMLMLGERVGPRRWTAIAIGFVGALIVIRPGFGDGVNPLGAVLLLGSCTAYGLYAVLTRRVAEADPAATSVAYSSLIAATVTTCLVPVVWITPQSLGDAAMFIGMGVLGALGHWMVAQAYRYAEASSLAPFGYVQLVGAASMGYLVFGDLPSVWTWVGAAVIVSSGLYVAHREAVLARARA